MTQTIQSKRTLTPDLAPTGLAEGELSIELASATPKLWVGVPVAVDPAGRRLLNPPGGVFVGDAPPAAPTQGAMWWESDTGILWLWYVDADSAQWVQAAGSVAPVVDAYTKAESDATNATQDTAINDRVLRTGDTMTGDLAITNLTGISAVFLDASAAGAAVVQSRRAGIPTWNFGQNTFGDFYVERSNDLGTTIDSPLTINRATGNVNVSGAAPRINLNKTASGSSNAIVGTVAGAPRFTLHLGDDTPEAPGAGTNAGSQFKLEMHADDNSWAYTMMSGTRETGQMYIGFLNTDGIDCTANSGFGKSFTPLTGWGSSMKLSFKGINADPLQSQNGLSLRPAIDDAYPIVFGNAADNAVTGSISQNASAVFYNTSSSGELKEDLKSFDAGNIIDQTEVYDFKWKQTGERSYGVIAQQAITVYPQAVTHKPMSHETLAEVDSWGVDYSKYVPVLLQELKALRARVAQLEGGVVTPKKG
jgi:hypothetical protein